MQVCDKYMKALKQNANGIILCLFETPGRKDKEATV